MSVIGDYIMGPGVSDASQKYLDKLLKQAEEDKKKKESGRAVERKGLQKVTGALSDGWDYTRMGACWAGSRFLPIFVKSADWQMSSEALGITTGREPLNFRDYGTRSALVSTSAFSVEGGVALDRITTDLGLSETHLSNLTLKIRQKRCTFGGTSVRFEQMTAFEYQVLAPDGVLDSTFMPLPFGKETRQPWFAGSRWPFQYPVDAARLFVQGTYWLQETLDDSSSAWVRPLAYPLKVADALSDTLVGYNLRWTPLKKDEKYDAPGSTERFVSGDNPSELSTVKGVDLFFSGRNLGRIGVGQPTEGLLPTCYFTVSLEEESGTQVLAKGYGGDPDFELEFIRKGWGIRFDAPKWLGEGSGIPWLKASAFAAYKKGTEHYEVSPGAAARAREENQLSGLAAEVTENADNPLGTEPYGYSSMAGGLTFGFTFGTAKIPFTKKGPDIDWKVRFGWEGSVENKRDFRTRSTYNPSPWKPNISLLDLVSIKFQRINNPIQYFDREGKNPLGMERKNRWEIEIAPNGTEWLWRWVGGSDPRFPLRVSFGREYTDVIGGGRKETFSFAKVTLSLSKVVE